MLGELSPTQIEQVLFSEVVARLGCAEAGRPYVVPVTYAYDGRYVYGHSAEGEKIRVMRRNPTVCLEVERVEDLANWQSVIAWGTFEELHGDAAIRASRFLEHRLNPFTTARSAPLEVELTEAGRPPLGAPSGRPIVVYRIRLTEKSGRYERAVTIPLTPAVEPTPRHVPEALAAASVSTGPHGIRLGPPG